MIVENAEAMELHLSATIEGGSSMDESQLHDKVESMLRNIAREAGVRVSDVHLTRVGEIEPGTIEAEADWLSE